MKTAPLLSRLCIALIVCQLFAQTNSGRISGTVIDSSGAVVAGASVVITNQGTALKWKSVTNSSGFYVVTSLPVGGYSVQVEGAGFRKAQKTGLDLADAARLTADFKLELGSVTETVVVSEVLGETVNTVSGEVSHTIDSEQVQDLALNGRNYLQLVSLIPGVALLDEDQMATTTSLSVTTWAANGGRPGTSHLMVDGGMNLDSGSNGSQINNVGVDFVSQLRVQTSNFAAEYGRNSGAAVNVVTKSGTAKFHGGLVETLRNDYFDAKDYFAPVKPILRFADFGWNLGGPIAFGPIQKGKLFFFAGQEWKRIRRFTSPTRRTLPTLAEIRGDFSDRTNAIRYPGTTTPIPNKDLTNLMTPDGKAIMKVFGEMTRFAPNYSSTATANNATFQVLEPFNWRQDIVKIDYQPSGSHRIYARWIHDNYDLVNAFGTFNSSQLPNTPTARNRPGYGPQMGHTWNISPRVLNELKINTAWNGQRTPLEGENWKRSTFGFQFPLVFGGNGPYPTGIPDINIAGFATYNGPARVYLLSPTTDIALSDNVTYIRGQHTVRAGVMIIRNRKDQNGRTPYNGSAVFNTGSPNNNSTGFALADAALGNFQSYSEAGSDPVGFFRFTQYEGFAQDTWKASRRLSLDIGMRYSYFVPTYTQGNNIVNFDPSLYDAAKAVSITAAGAIVPNSGDPFIGLIRAGDSVPQDQIGRVANANSTAVPSGAPRGLYPSYNLWSPRFGFSWAPAFGGGKTALRGGFGVFHDRVQGNLIFSQLNISPFSTQVSYESGNLANPLGGTAAALAVMGSINAIDPRLKTPVKYDYSLTVDRELPHGLFLQLTYSGNVQHHLLRQPDINFPTFPALVANNNLPTAQRAVTNALRPYKGFSNIRMFLSDANGNYNSLQTYFTKRKGSTVLTASYTWSHALADASSDTENADGGLGYPDRHFNYGPTSFDRRHIVVVTYTYRLPFLVRRHGFLGTAFGGWEISGITRAQSGPHLTPVGSSTGVTRRADYVGGEVSLPSGERGADLWFNKAAFRNAPSTALGNAGVGTIVAPGLYLWDATMRKVFKIREGWSLRLNAQVFNLMNHVNFRSLNVTTGNIDFGTLSASGPARNIQFGLQLTF
jgi:hypothetical protein